MSNLPSDVLLTGVVLVAEGFIALTHCCTYYPSLAAYRLLPITSGVLLATYSPRPTTRHVLPIVDYLLLTTHSILTMI